MGIERKLGTELYGLRNELVRTMVILRGGTAANVQETGPWADCSLEETATAAMNGIKEAEKAVKIVKQAKRLGAKY